jgi:hypothetical protein
MGRFLVVIAAIGALTACKDKSKSEGLPPAQEWSASAGTLPPAPGAANPHAGMNPHAGANPHAGMAPPNPHGADPHAGIDMNNPHGSPNVAAMGLPPPDPNRKINPNNKVAGTIKVHAKAKDRVKPGTSVFVIVKKAGPDGAPVGPPLAVEKLTWGTGDLAFEMTEKQAMIAGTELTGDVVVTARYDQDGDALSKEKGDISGSIRVKVPAEKVTLTLDEILQ